MTQNAEPLDLVPADDNAPDPGWTTEVEITRIIDADTVEVEVRRRFTVRLSHPTKRGYIFDTPEKNTELGKKAIEWLKNELDDFNGVVTLFIDAKKNLSLMDWNSFSRAVGELWLDKSRLTSKLLKSGYARIVKRSERTTTPWE